MKYLLAIVLSLLVAACATPLPKPVNADGTVNPSVAVAELKVTYGNVAHGATAYISTCHADMSTIGCSDRLIAQIKVASEKAAKAIEEADKAIKTLPPGAKGIDEAIGYAKAAIQFLKSFTGAMPQKFQSMTRPVPLTWEVA